MPLLVAQPQLGYPNLVRFLERLANQAPQTGWRGLLVGDMSQPRDGRCAPGNSATK
jgi:penicillin-insensitive murein endopeptidase